MLSSSSHRSKRSMDPKFCPIACLSLLLLVPIPPFSIFAAHHKSTAKQSSPSFWFSLYDNNSSSSGGGTSSSQEDQKTETSIQATAKTSTNYRLKKGSRKSGMKVNGKVREKKRRLMPDDLDHSSRLLPILLLLVLVARKWRRRQ